MLEVYQAYTDMEGMLELTQHLVAACALAVRGTTELTYQGRPLDLTPDWERVTMVEAVERATGVHFDLGGSGQAALSAARRLGVDCVASWTPGRVLAEVFDQLVDPHLWGPVFVTEYPVEVSPLARPDRRLPHVTERFEAFVAGRELANAFSELNSPDLQRQRFEEQVAEASEGDQEAMPYDRDYVRALEYGLPPTGGLGIGVDRLVMILTDTDNIREVVSFPTLRPEVW